MISAKLSIEMHIRVQSRSSLPANLDVDSQYLAKVLMNRYDWDERDTSIRDAS